MVWWGRRGDQQGGADDEGFSWCFTWRICMPDRPLWCSQRATIFCPVPLRSLVVKEGNTVAPSKVTESHFRGWFEIPCKFDQICAKTSVLDGWKEKKGVISIAVIRRAIGTCLSALWGYIDYHHLNFLFCMTGCFLYKVLHIYKFFLLLLLFIVIAVLYPAKSQKYEYTMIHCHTLKFAYWKVQPFVYLFL